MSKSVNKVILIGHIGREPEAKNNRTMASLATSDRRKVNDAWEETTEWHNLVFFGRLAEIARDYIHKGSKIYVEGKLHSYSYNDTEGVKRYRTDIIVQDLSLLDGAGQRNAAADSEYGGGE